MVLIGGFGDGCREAECYTTDLGMWGSLLSDLGQLEGVRHFEAMKK
jgi:hypothetical protein